MSRVFCPIFEGRIKDRIVFATYEDAEAILGAGNFVEETEETGPFYVGGTWDGATHTPPTEEEKIAFNELLASTFLSNLEPTPVNLIPSEVIK